MKGTPCHPHGAPPRARRGIGAMSGAARRGACKSASTRARTGAALLVAALCLAGELARAQQPVPMPRAVASGGALELSAAIESLREVAGEDGSKRSQLAPFVTGAPGDEVVYTVAFRNVGLGSAPTVQITVPVPASMRYVPASAVGPGTEVLYSADGGRTYGAPDAVFVLTPDGEERRADAEEYTHIRWVLSAALDAGAKGFVRFRAIVR